MQNMTITSPIPASMPWQTPQANTANPAQRPPLNLSQMPLGWLDNQTGLLQINESLMNHLSKQGAVILPALYQHLSTSQSPSQIASGLYLAQKLAQQKTMNLNSIYSIAARRFNASRDPLVQTYLAGFYRHLQEPSAFGPLLKMLATNPQTNGKTPFDPNEEIGGALLDMIAKEAARKIYSPTISESRQLNWLR